MNLFISVDIEGCTGIVSFSQCGRADSQHFDYSFARRMLVHDLNAVIRGARRGGATRIVLKDAHGNCKNLLIDELEPGVELISGQGPVLDGMMDGIDGSFGAAMLVGYHGMAGATAALMDHALVGGLHRLWIDGIEAGEMLVSAGVAGEYGVPLAFVTSDREGCKEARASIPGVPFYATKAGYGRYMGRVSAPSATCAGLEAASESAMLNVRAVRPLRMPAPIHMCASFRSSEEAEMASVLPGVERADGYSLKWTAATFLEAHRTAVRVFQLSIVGRKLAVK